MSSPDVHDIRFAGLGGQGVVLAGLLLGQTAVVDGLYASGADSYGAQARGSVCLAEVRLSVEPIDYPHVEDADLLVTLSQDGYDTCRDRVSEDGLLLYDSGLVKPADTKPRQRGYDVAAIALDELHNTQVANVIWVGVVAATTGWFSDDALREAVRLRVPERFLDLNLQALERGLELGRAGAGDEGIERFSLEEARGEARPCLSSNECRGCQMCVLLCPDQAISLDEASGRPVIDLAFCKHCELCAHFCPKGAISMEAEVT
jgi:2-oxoglutarate ferredoxin oxidoreductase subunit gamma